MLWANAGGLWPTAPISFHSHPALGRVTLFKETNVNTMDASKDAKSKKILAEVQDPLRRLIYEVAKRYPTNFFIVTEGMRSLDRQRELVAAGASQTMKSRHLTGHAVDVAMYILTEEHQLLLRWDWPLYANFAQLVQSVSKDMAIPIVWGGGWKTLKDGPHFELDRAVYP